jgi:proteasome assembly chaperone (PAC2) family protein
MLNIEQWPKLREPVLVVALSGWVDAGSAGVGAAAALAEQLQSAQRFGQVDIADLLDLQQTRPTVRMVDGTTREIVWPVIDLVAGRAGCDVVLVIGPEPSLHWRAFTAELVTLAQRLDVRLAATLGGMPAVVSHRRPAPVLATATSRALAQEVGALRFDYLGPTGAQSVLQVALGEADIPAVGLWAQVPHYVAGNRSSPAIRALLERLRDVAGVQTDLRAMDTEVDEYLERVEGGLAERPDVAEMIRTIETDQHDLPTGDELVSEIERFLRDEPG